MFNSLLNRMVAPENAQLTIDHRNRYGHIASFGGLLANLLLTIIKAVIGLSSGSVAILGDAANNLADALTSLITMLSFKLSARPADREHPFGHARYEYLFSALVSLSILFVGFQLILESVKRILHPEILPFSLLLTIILLLSILGKVALWAFYKDIAKRIDSSLIRANAVDSLSDVRATTGIVIALILSPVLGFDLDGYMGIVVAALVIKSGIDILRETINKLLGPKPDPAMARQISEFVRSYSGVYGIHDFTLHDYGPGHQFATLHVEVDYSAPAMDSHDLIDRIEIDAYRQFGVRLTIHMDPLVLDDPRTNELHALALRIIHNIDPNIDLHDFRLVQSCYTTNLVFDLALPADCQITTKQLTARINSLLQETDPHLMAKINYDPIYLLNEPDL